MTTSIRRTISFHLLVLLPLLAQTGCRAADAAPGACVGPIDVRSQDDVAALASCRTVDGDVRITGSGVSDTRGLEGLTSVRYLIVVGTSLRDLSGLAGLREAGGITIAANPVLETLQGLEGIEALDGLVIAENDSLTTIAALAGLQRAGEMTVAGNARLASLAPLSSLGQAGELALGR